MTWYWRRKGKEKDRQKRKSNRSVHREENIRMRVDLGRGPGLVKRCNEYRIVVENSFTEHGQTEKLHSLETLETVDMSNIILSPIVAEWLLAFPYFYISIEPYDTHAACCIAEAWMSSTASAGQYNSARRQLPSNMWYGRSHVSSHSTVDGDASTWTGPLLLYARAEYTPILQCLTELHATQSCRDRFVFDWGWGDSKWILSFFLMYTQTFKSYRSMAAHSSKSRNTLAS